VTDFGKPYLSVVALCEESFRKHGDNHLGVGWTKGKEEADQRYQVMLDLIRPSEKRVSVLDFGCGLSHLYEYIEQTGNRLIDYQGLDLSDDMLAASRRKHPQNTYLQGDVLDGFDLPVYDYIILNGLFNSKRQHSFDDMFAYMLRLITATFAKARAGIAFNVMTKYVDWERDDLFYVRLDDMARVVVRDLSRHFVIRHDYGAFEYTVYVYHEPAASYRGVTPSRS
jgi:SAM-dependent methyltransferase